VAAVRFAYENIRGDRSVEIARDYEQQDKRIKVIAAHHTGRGQALRDAIAQTQGKYLGIIDSDDLLAREAIEETAFVLDSQPRVGMVYTDYLVVDEQGEVKGLGKRCQIPYSKDRLLLDFMTFHFRLIRRSLYDTVGGVDPEFKAAQDYDLCLRLSEVTEIVQIKKPLYLYRNHADNISHNSQFEQIHFTQLAIMRALSRRGMASDWDLEVRVQPQYLLRRKKKTGGKILGIGLGKTGTTSLCEALKILGYQTIHLPQTLYVLDYYQAAADTPVAIAYQQLDQKYPGSKFILTLRPLEKWLISHQKHERKLQSLYQGKFPQRLKELRLKAYGQWQFEVSVWQATYERHHHSVLEYFRTRQEDLLVLNICTGEGWEKLCPFLGQQTPKRDFPWENADGHWQHNQEFRV
jgi:glycosyltransferase involved in cell wall biosynthesis